MEHIKIRLLVTPIYTLKSKKFIYSLADMAYGEWIVFKNDYPKFYINILEHKSERTIYDNFESQLEHKLKNIDSQLSLKQHIIGFRSSKSHFQWFELEKLLIGKVL